MWCIMMTICLGLGSLLTSTSSSLPEAVSFARRSGAGASLWSRDDPHHMPTLPGRPPPSIAPHWLQPPFPPRVRVASPKPLPPQHPPQPLPQSPRWSSPPPPSPVNPPSPSSSSANTPAARVAAELNRRWRLPDATHDLATAGVLVHTLDGDGIGKGGWVRPDVNDPLRNIWSMDSGRQEADRMGSSLINVRHPEIFRCLGACGDEWYDLPAIVLKPTHAVQRRLNCLGWRDLASLFFDCDRPGGDDDDDGCKPGCPPRWEWCDKGRGGVDDQYGCHVGGFLFQMPECCFAHPPEDWASLLAFQDAFAPHGPCNRETQNCDDSTKETGWLFNEIVLDRFRHPWEPDLADMIEAVIIAPGASARKGVRTSRARCSAPQDRADASLLPLLYYDVMERHAPFSVEIPSRFTPECNMPDDSKCSDLGGDCCAPQGIGEEASCSDGYVPVRFYLPCDRWPGWTNGKFGCCSPAA